MGLISLLSVGMSVFHIKVFKKNNLGLIVLDRQYLWDNVSYHESGNQHKRHK